jgi:cyclophilin family peptidyl-prolyl cis-trans isomerase
LSGKGPRPALALMMVVAVLLVGCGKKAVEVTGTFAPTAGAGSETSTVSAQDMDVTSGCWKASDRVSTSTAGGNGSVAYQQWKQPPAMTIDVNKTYTATLETSDGTIDVEFYPKDAPVTVNNFVCLAEAGYYNGTPFHRIVAGFVIQGGDPTGTGTGGPGYKFNDEKVTKDYTAGTLAMANSGPNTNGSQFFICTADLTGKLPKNYTIFGKVTGGMDIVSKIEKTPTKVNSSGEKSTPINPVTLNNVTITAG